MRCFFQGPACSGPVRRARGTKDSSWLNGAVDRRTGYCRAHMAGQVLGARWEPIKRGRKEGARDDG